VWRQPRRTSATEEPNVKFEAARSEVETPAAKAVASRKQISVATQKAARTKHHLGANTKAGFLRYSRMLVQGYESSFVGIAIRAVYIIDTSFELREFGNVVSSCLFPLR
jgi:hypothetical protein